MGDVVTAEEQSLIDAQHQQQLARLAKQHQEQFSRLAQQHQAAMDKREKRQKELIASYEHQLELMQVDFKETSMQFSREKKEIDGLYRKKLEALNTQMTAMTSKISELNALKERFATLAAPAPLKNKMTDSSGRGGPLRPISFKSSSNAYL